MKQSKKIIFGTILTLAISGCVSPSVPSNPSASLPRILNLKTISDISEIGFEWAPINDENVVGYQIYRRDPDSQVFKPVARIDDRFATHFVDRNLKAQSEYAYQIKTFSAEAISNEGEIVVVSTKPLLNSVPFAQALHGLPNRVKLIWRPHPDNSVVGYIIHKSDNNPNKFYKIATIEGRLSAEYIDKDVKPARNYKYRIYVKNGNDIISKPSEVIEATTKELPNPVLNLKASIGEPKKIILTWQKPEVKDFSHFNIYRASSKILPFSLIAKTEDSHYEDLLNENGDRKYYRVTSVDKDGLESIKDAGVVGETLQAPLAPAIMSAEFDGTGINLNWVAKDKRAKYYILQKNGETLESGLEANGFYDSAVELGQKYSYKVIAVDEFGIQSKASDSASISTK